MNLLERLGMRFAKLPPDTLWPTRSAKFDGIGTLARRQRSRGSVVIVVAHFPETFAELERCFSLCGLRAEAAAARAPVPSSGLGSRSRDPLRLLRADALVAEEHATARTGGDVYVHVAERHPLRRRDDELIRRARWPRMRVHLRFHVSLEDPLLVSTGAAAHARSLLQRLAGDEAVENKPCGVSHPLIARAVRDAQAEIGRQARRDIGAASAQEWLRLNCGRAAA